mgnify:FL=1
MILLSVVIPLYNGKDYIKRNIESLKKVKCSKEIIIVDDGSTDDSYLYCCEIFNNDDEVCLIHQDNAGIAAARNKGMEFVRGKYVIFVDQDDLINPKTVNRAIQKIEMEKTDLLMWSTARRDEQGNMYPCDTVNFEIKVKGEVIQKQFLLSMIYEHGNQYISYIGHVWSGIYDVDFIKKYNIFFHCFVNYEDDYLFVFDCLRNASCVYFFNEIGYYWSINNKSYSFRQRHLEKYYEKMVQLYTYLLESLKQVLDFQLIEDIMSYCCQTIILKTMRNCGCNSKIDKGELRQIKEILMSDEYKNVWKGGLKYNVDLRFRILYYSIKFKIPYIGILLTHIYYTIFR